MDSFVPPGHLEDLFPPPGKSVMTWRNTDLREILRQRDGWCRTEGCNGHVTSSIHEGIITKGDVMGWQPKARRLTINCGINCLILCDLCHDTPREPAREEVAAFMCDEYGRDVVCEWLLSLDFKTPHPMQIWAHAHKE